MRLVAMLGAIALALLISVSIPVLGTVTAEPPTEDVEFVGPRQSARAWTSSDPVWGNDFNERAIFVHQSDATYLDDMLFAAAVPAAVHWENGTRYDSMIISDHKNRENGNLIGDYAYYLDATDAEPVIDYIGDVESARKTELDSYFTDRRYSNNVTTATDVYQGSADIAKYYWQDQRMFGTDTAVLAYVPESHGGVEVRQDFNGLYTGAFAADRLIDGSDTAWLRFFVNWSDPGANTDYRIGIKDPYALHQSEYHNQGAQGHVNPTNNKLYDHKGHMDLGLSPYHSQMPYAVDKNPQGWVQEDFTGTLPDGDVSLFPINGAGDYLTFQVGPIRAGQYIGVYTEWEYYNHNLTEFRDFNTYVYRPGQPVGPEYHLEVISNDHFDPMNMRGTPELGYCYADVGGYYNVTVHPYLVSKGGDFNLTVYYGTLDEISTWRCSQYMPGDDQMEYHIQEYEYFDDLVVESVTNGATAASLLNSPMLYTAGGAPETVVVDALKDIGIKNLVVFDPGNLIPTGTWTSEGFNIERYSTDTQIFNYVYDLAQDQGIKKGLILNGLGGPWWTGAALAGAYKGMPVPAMDDAAAHHVLANATQLWWQVTQDGVDFDKAPINEYAMPSQAYMQNLADDFYGWIETFNADFNPNCGDADADGAPDNGAYWDYSNDIEVLVISPMNALKPCIDRAIHGKASIGRVTAVEPEVQWAILNRQMMYWKVGYSQADNPDNPNDAPPIFDHWRNAGWTFNTYAHDDGIMDNDSGDIDDDDFCGVDDGGTNHLAYKGREDWPSYAATYGRTNEYHTYYDNIRDMLEAGTCHWSENGHGHTYWMMETGMGFTGTGVDPADPQFGGPVPDDGFVDPPLATTAGWDWYYGMDSVHSTFSTYQSCLVGGSMMGEYFLRMGGIGTIGGYVTRSLLEATIQSDRTTQGLFMYNMTFGDAHRWGADETGCMYSLKDPGPVLYNYQDKGYPDNVCYRKGDTGHTILLGDPGLRMIAPTLWVDAEWNYDTGVKPNLTIEVRNQYGDLVTIDDIEVHLDGMVYGVDEVSTGVYEIDWAEDGVPVSFEALDIIVSKAGYASPMGGHDIKKSYNCWTPTIDVDADIQYVGGTGQGLTFGMDFTSDHIEGNLTNLHLETIEYSLMPAGYNLPNETVMAGPMYYLHERIGLDDVDTSAIPDGDYVLTVWVKLFDLPTYWMEVGTVSVVHEVYFTGPEIEFVQATRLLNMTDLKVLSTCTTVGTLGLADILSIGYEMFDTQGVSAGISGTPAYNDTSETFEIMGLDLTQQKAGEFYLKVTVQVNSTLTKVVDTSVFSVQESALLTIPQIVYIDGFEQQVNISNVVFSTTEDLSTYIPMDKVQNHTYVIKDSMGVDTALSGNLYLQNGAWRASMRAFHLPEGEYYAQVSFSADGFGTATRASSTFEVKHTVEIRNPFMKYDQMGYHVNVTFQGASSYGPMSVVNQTNYKSATWEFMKGNQSTGVTGDLEWTEYSWTLDRDVSDLAPGNYTIKLSLGALSSVATDESQSFVVPDITLSVPIPVASNEGYQDHVHISVQPKLSNGILLDTTTATMYRYEIYDLNDTLVLEGDLDHNGTHFIKNLWSLGNDLVDEQQYYVIVKFQAVNTEVVSAQSGNFQYIADPGPSTDGVDGDGDPDGEDGGIASNPGYMIAALVIVVVILLIIVGIVVFLVMKNRGPDDGIPAPMHFDEDGNVIDDDEFPDEEEDEEEDFWDEDVDDPEDDLDEELDDELDDEEDDIEDEEEEPEDEEEPDLIGSGDPSDLSGRYPQDEDVQLEDWKEDDDFL